jgi:hypothetical protein
MGCSSSKTFEKEAILTEIIDQSDEGYIHCSFGNLHYGLKYKHPQFPSLRQRLKVETAYHLTIGSDSEILDVDTPKVITITGMIEEFIDQVDNYSEILLAHRPVEVPYTKNYAKLLIEKDRTKGLPKNTLVELKIQLFQGPNRYLVKEVTAVK